MARDNVQQFDQPQTQKSASTASSVDAKIFVMPEPYRHGASGVLHQPPSTKTQKNKPPVQIQKPTPLPPKQLNAVPQKQSSSRKKLVVIGGIVLLVLLISGFLAIRYVQQNTEVRVVTPEPPPVVVPPIPEPEEEVTPEEPEDLEEEPIEDAFPTDILPGVDSDSDGLTDVEEESIYLTDPKLPDTDADGFLDGNEVFHGYNPGGTAPGTLFESDLVAPLAGDINGDFYELYYPTVWTLQRVEETLVLDTQTGEGFTISFEEKGVNQTLDDWYSQRSSSDETLLAGTTKNGFSMIQTQNQLQALVDIGTSVLIIEYETGIKARVDYLQTLQMMLNSLRVLDASP